MSNCVYCPNTVYRGNRCDSCGKGPLCVEHSTLCIMMSERDQYFDPQYDRDRSVRCTECISAGKPNRGFAPVIGKCFSCLNNIWKIESCSVCGDGPFCSKCCNNFGSTSGEKDTQCRPCKKYKKYSAEWRHTVNNLSKNDIDKWLESHPGWEEHNREAYMKYAEEKWRYKQACKIRANIQSEEVNNKIFTNKWKK